MMNELEIQQLLEEGWRRPLTPEEEAGIRGWCRSHPDRREEIEADLALSRSLHGLPDVPVASNFTSQVWLGIEQSERKERLAAAKAPRRGFAWLPRLAAGVLVLTLSVGLWMARPSPEDQATATGLASTIGLSDPPEAGMFSEFEAIRVMSESSSSVVDVDLLAALQ